MAQAIMTSSKLLRSYETGLNEKGEPIFSNKQGCIPAPSNARTVPLSPFNAAIPVEEVVDMDFVKTDHQSGRWFRGPFPSGSTVLLLGELCSCPDIHRHSYSHFFLAC